jgi:hypothetical protein
VNLLTTLNVDGCINLQSLSCPLNYLTNLDVRDCENLDELVCYENELTTLNVAGLENLTYLDCEDNHLTAVNLTASVLLEAFYGENQVVSLSMQSNGDTLYVTTINLNTPTFGNSAISYNSGILTSRSKTATTTSFEVETGASGFKLSGTMNLSYPTGIATHPSTEVTIYPNPTNGKITIENGNSVINNVSVYDITGRILHTSSTISQEMTIDISHLSAGVYFLQVDGKMVKVVKN